MSAGWSSNTMSSIFPSQFADAGAPSRPRRTAPRDAGFLRKVSSWFGRATQRTTTPAAAPHRKDWDDQAQAMLAAASRLATRTRRDNQPLSIVVFDLKDLPELESVFGPQVAKKVLDQVVDRLQGLASAKGLVIRTDATVFTVLMPGFGRDRAHEAIEHSMGSPCCFELDADDHELVLIPDFKVHTVRPDSGPLAGVYTDLRRDIHDAQKHERRRQRYLQLERESHTRPMELRAERAPKPVLEERAVYRPADATIPMPLKR
jgi:GGDEF domain-containing protein